MSAAGSRLAAALWVAAGANLLVIVVYELVTTFRPVGEAGWGGAGSSLAVAALAGAVAGWFVVQLRGGGVALAVLGLLLIVEAAVTAQVLSSVGNGYATWEAQGGTNSAWTLRWAGLVSGLALALVGRWRLNRSTRAEPRALDSARVLNLLPPR